jgi:hypothetical protein
MRHRSNTDQAVAESGGNWTFQRNGGAVETPSAGPFQPTPAGYSLLATSDMTDDISSSRSTKEVTHEKDIRWMATISSLVIDVPPNLDIYQGPRVYWNGAAGWGPPPFEAMGNDQYTFTYPRTDQQFIADSFDSFFNRNQVDNLLNIVESSDIIPRLQSIETKVSTLGNNGGSPTRFLRKGSVGRNARNLVGNVAGGFLYYSFAIAPLLSDFKKLRKAVQTIQSDLKKARLLEGKVEKMHFQMKARITRPLTGNWDPLHDTSIGPRYLSREGGEIGVKTIVIKGTRRPAFSSSALGGLNELMTRFGSSGPASFVWERIPFSFVVDWFVDLRSITNRLDNLLTGSGKKVLDASFSELTETTTNLVHLAHNTAQNPGLNNTTVAWRLHRQYHRYPLGTPFGVRPSGRFGKKQGSLMVALAYQVVAKLLSARR